MVPFVERRYVFTGNGVFVCKTNVGQQAYANGYQATMFDFYKDKGIAYLKAEGPPQIVRTVFAMDKVEADKVALRARAARKRADRLTGYAAGEELEVEEQEVLLVE
jgi:DNA segregation ATPase FtsK/SpoIIIE, S-DNA-T family